MSRDGPTPLEMVWQMVLLVGALPLCGVLAVAPWTAPEMPYSPTTRVVMSLVGTVGFVVSVWAMRRTTAPWGPGDDAGSPHHATRPPAEPALPPFPQARPPWIHPRAWAQHTDPSRYAMGRPEPGDPIEHHPAEMPQHGPRIEPEEQVPVGDIEEQLSRTPPVVGIWNPGSWPVCCERLAVLQALEPTPEEACSFPFAEGTWADVPSVYGEDHLDEAIAARAEVDSAADISVAVFACSVCGRAAADVTFT